MLSSNLLLLLPATLLLSAQPPNLGGVALRILKTWQPALGLDQRHTFGVNAITPDPVMHRVDVRITQYYQGVPVFGGEAIMHMKGEQAQSFTDQLQRKLELNTKPSLTPSEGLALALKDLAPRGPFVIPPTTELVITRLKPAKKDALAYHIHTELENGTLETAHTDYLIDAHSGAITKKWSSLHTTKAEGIGHSQFSGKVLINTTATRNGFELRDPIRGDSGNTVLDLAHRTSDSGGNLFTNSTNTWGDGENYAGGDTTSVNGQTAAVDAAYGAQASWDYFKNVHGRNGIDGNGTATTMRVHYSTAYDNAFWSDSCFCMTFGDGSRFKSMEAIDVLGHEMSHGVCSNTARLQYFGESGGLNEANSDIHGAMVEFYARGGSGATIGETGGNWTIGEQLATASFNRPLRYMYKPSLDGLSPDAWSSRLDGLDVHYSSGPMNRCFYFLSQGASGQPSSNFYTERLPHGMPGIGNDKAARIWYRTLASYLTSSADYADARKGCIASAQDLYGAGSLEEQAVWNAFSGINVGKAWPAKPVPTNTVKATILAPAADLTIASGQELRFTGAATDSNPAAILTCTWSFGDGQVGTGTSATHVFLNPGATDLKRTVTFKATDETGATDSATRTITVSATLPPPAPEGAETILNGGFESGPLHWEGNTEKIGAWRGQAPFAGKRYAYLLGSGKPSQETLRQVVILPMEMTGGTLSFQLQVQAPQSGTASQDTLAVQLLTTSGTTTLGTFSNLDATSGYVRKVFPLPALKEDVAILLFRAQGTGAAQTSFALDNVSLVAK